MKSLFLRAEISMDMTLFSDVCFASSFTLAAVGVPLLFVDYKFIFIRIIFYSSTFSAPLVRQSWGTGWTISF